MHNLDHKGHLQRGKIHPFAIPNFTQLHLFNILMQFRMCTKYFISTQQSHLKKDYEEVNFRNKFSKTVFVIQLWVHQVRKIYFSAVQQTRMGEAKCSDILHPFLKTSAHLVISHVGHTHSMEFIPAFLQQRRVEKIS